MKAQSEEVGTAFTAMGGLATKLAGAFGIAFSIREIVQFGRSVVEAGTQIQKMADQTGIGIAEVQKLQYIAGQSGTSIEALVSAVQNLQQRLGDDSTGAAGAMKQLGINADAFNKLDTYSQMTTLAEAIRNIHNPTEQASVAAELFGKTWKEILPAIKSGMRDLGEQATVMTDQTVRSLTELENAWHAWTQRATAEAATWALFMKAHFVTVDDSAEGFTAQLDQMQKTAARALPTVAVNLRGVEMSALALKHAEDDLTKAAEESIAAHEKEAAEWLRQLKAVHDIEAMNNAFSLRGIEEINQVSATANAHRMADTLATLPQLQKAQDALADYTAKTTLSSSDYQIRELWRVVDEQEKAYGKDELLYAEYSKTIRALAQQKADALIAIERQKEADLLTIVVGHGPDVPNAGAGRSGLGLAGIQIHADILRSIAGMDSITGGAEAKRQMQMRGLVFDHGGPVLRDGPIYAHAGEYVLPKGGGATTIVNHIYVNGTAAEVARKVADEIMRTQKMRTKFGAT
jgi:hypothetical protein